jgi:hypothetical protein
LAAYCGRRLSISRDLPIGICEVQLKRVQAIEHRLPVAFCLAVVGIVYSTLLAIYLAPRDTIQNLDFWTWVDLGQRLNGTNLETWVNGLYPLGYPLLLRVAIDHGLDSLRTSQWLSWLGGLLCLVAVAGIAYHATRRAIIALLSVTLLVVNVQFLSNAASEGTDMLTAGLQLLSLYLLWICTPRQSVRQSNLLICGAGFALGLAYLVRYTALLILPGAVLYCLWIGANRKQAVLNAVLMVGTYLLAASPQIAASTVVAHQPFYNWQAKNVWFGLYGQGDWVNNWSSMSDTVSLLEVMAIDPAYFVEHWWTQFASAFYALLLWTPVLQVAWLAGVVAVVGERRWQPARRMLLVLTMLLPIVVTSMAWLSSRFLLVTLALQAVVIVLLAERLAGRLPLSKQLQTVALTVGLMAVVAAGQLIPLAQWLGAPANTHPLAINSFLRSAGMSDPTEVATNDPSLHAADLPARTRYAQTYAVAAAPQTLAELLKNPAASEWRFLVMDYKNGFGDYHAIRQAALNAKSQLAPIYINKTQIIFCVAPCALGNTVRDDITFDNGMRLLGHRAQEGDGQLTLYLYWQVGRTPDRSYKVSARVLDGSGAIFLQVDNVPQLWTYPTNVWTAHETIVDFYDLRTDSRLPSDYQLALVVYDDQSLKPASALTTDGKPIGAVVSLPLSR